ncbi:proline dehydrogenase 1, mitochondrial isoform X2 [Aplysia californica]|uniref:Proline dehydrogenase n=1 Tax=Aplysia californica TaxID=6500 RepID=A0ABM1A7F6_APLCA|nr:proline dehydrogenase 1, mitochondrial isoform X2 [Aplysia californica]
MALQKMLLVKNLSNIAGKEFLRGNSSRNSLYRLSFTCRSLDGISSHTVFKSTLPNYEEAPSSSEQTGPTGREWKSLTGNHEHPELDLSFGCGKEAYKSKKTSEVLRALLVFNLCSLDFLVNNQKRLLQMSRKLMGPRLFSAMMRQTFYGHFVAGADQEEIKPVASRIKQFGVKSILDYSAEEDISSEAAVEAEMEGCVPQQNELENPGQGAGLKNAAAASQYRAHEEFGDRREKVTSARTYFYESEAQCDKNMQIFLNCIDAVSHATEKSGFAAIKLTALGKPQLLLQMSEVLMTAKNFFAMLHKTQGEIDTGELRFGLEDFDSRLREIGVQLQEGKKRTWVSVKDISADGCEVDLLDWSNLLEINRSLSKLLVVPNFKTGKLQPLVEAMTEEEEDQMKNMLRRVNKLAKYAQEKEVRVMIDAEQSYFQPAIRRLTMEMMRKFNKERSVIFNTYQCYTKEAYNDILVDMDLARREDFYFGAKLVRGAYMEQERERAASLGYEDPINPSYEATTEMMHRVVEEVMRQIHMRPVGRMAVMIASHNEDTVRYTIQKMKEYGIGPNDRLICFGQLFGMCDQISFPLGQAGYSVYKYVPFGPVEEVLPYLSRRAMENRGVLLKVKKERRLLRQELFRRIGRGQIFYKPVTSEAVAAK